MKKVFSTILAVLLTLGMLVGAFAVPTFAADDASSVETITPDTSWYTGEEAQDVVYELYDAADLLGFAALGNSGITFKGVIVKLMADIDLNPGWDATTVVSGKEVTLASAPENVWNSIPTFEGTLDGNGKTISGIYSRNTDAIPTSGYCAVGGFIDRVVKGEIKDLTVLNSLSVISPASSTGTVRHNAGGFIGHCEDATLTTLYVDMDAWLKFDYHVNFGGMISSMGTNSGTYAGELKDIVFAGTVGVVPFSSNDYSSKGDRTENLRMGGVIAASQEWMGTKDIKLIVKNLAFTGTLYWPGAVSGDPVICYTSGGAYNVGFGVDNVGEYFKYVRSDKTISPVTDLNATATNILNNKNAASYGNANDTYADAGWVKVKYENGYGLNEILLPGSVVDMLNASEFVADKTSANVKVELDTSWYTGAENKDVVYYLYDAADLLGFSEIGNRGVTFFGATVKLMADIDLNPGWDATTVVNGTKVTLADAAPNAWNSIPTFEGVLDGNGNTVSGIYSYNTPTIPESVVLAVGGFIDRVVKGEIKNLIVLNSLSVTAPTSGFGSTRLNAGGFIGQCEDATLTTLYIDMDAWIISNYHANFGGMISAMGTSGSGYAGEVKDIVFAGAVGAITPSSNDYTSGGSRTDNAKYRFGGVVSGNIDWMAKTDIKLNIKNIAFVGALYWPGKASGDDIICYTSGGAYNVGFGADNVGNYYYYESSGAANLPTGATDINAVATNIFNNKNASSYGNSKDTYAEAGWVSVEHANGTGLKKILLPGSVADMLYPEPTNVYYQLGDGGRRIRFVGVIDITEEELENYSEVGFDIVMTYEGETYELSAATETVYTSILADGVSIPAGAYGGTYFYIVEITELGAAVSDIRFDISGFIVSENDGNRKLFGSKTISISADPSLSLPEIPGAFPSYTDTGDDCLMVNYGMIGKAKYDAYCADMVAQGFTLYAENEIEENVYRTYVNDRYVVTALYTEYNSVGKTLIEPLSKTALPSKAENNTYTAVNGCDTTVTQVGQYHEDDYDNTYNGMSYIIRLADGSFIIVDGGVETSRADYAERVYNILKKQAPDPNNIVIAAWIFTHGHGDHVDMFSKFSKTYSNKVTVERFIYNMPSAEQASGTGGPAKVRGGVDTYFPDALKTKAHPGQVFNIRNAVIEVYYTLDLFEKELSDFNNSSIVFSITTEGKKMMFLGDYADMGDTLLSLYGTETLKSDIVQVAHHGILGTSNELYEKIGATYAFWPGLRIYVRKDNQDLYSLPQNQYIVSLGDDKIFMAEDNVHVFTFKNNSCVFYDTVAEYLAK